MFFVDFSQMIFSKNSCRSKIRVPNTLNPVRQPNQGIVITCFQRLPADPLTVAVQSEVVPPFKKRVTLYNLYTIVSFNLSFYTNIILK